MGVNFKVYKDSFISKVKITDVPNPNEEDNKGKMIKSVTENDPIFKHLHSIWTIEHLLDKPGCSVEYKISFEFNSMLYQSASTYFLNFLGNHTFQAFVKQAESKNIEETQFED